MDNKHAFLGLLCILLGAAGLGSFIYNGLQNQAVVDHIVIYSPWVAGRINIISMVAAGLLMAPVIIAPIVIGPEKTENIGFFGKQLDQAWQLEYFQG